MPYNCPIGSASMIFSIFTVLQPSLKSNVSIFLSTKKKLCIQEQSLLNVLSNLPYFWFRQPLIYFLEKAVVPHSSTLAWKIPWTEEPGRLKSMGSLRVGYDSATSLSRIGEGNGNPLQCSCLENPRDGGGWWAAVYGVAQSQTRLK